MRYELIREIFNQCSNNQMRDVFVSEVETVNTDAFMKTFCIGNQIIMDKDVKGDGTVIYELVIDGLKQRFSFTPDD